MVRSRLRRDLVRAALCGAIAAGCNGADDGAPSPSNVEGAPDGTGTPVEDDPDAVYRVPLRVHVALSALQDPELDAVLAEMNAFWLSQAGICFDTTITADDVTADAGFDLWLSADPVFGSARTNGIYRGPHEVWSLDRPRLSASPTPIAYPAARTSAHELGHGLGLAHQNCGDECPCGESSGLNCDDLLMRSGYDGFALSLPEVSTAREHAAPMALPGAAFEACPAPRPR
jgi:hypothetical protein